MHTIVKKLTIFTVLFVMLFGIAVAVNASTGDTPAPDTQITTEEDKNTPEIAAADNGETSLKNTKAIAAAAVIGVVALGGALGMAFAIIKAVDSTARQPEAAGNIRTSLMLGLVFIETAIIYALIVAILIVFVL